MRKVILYIATSIDGFIAKEDGSIDWLPSSDTESENDYGYKTFYDSIDVTLMGRKTYEQIMAFPVPFPYPDKKNYVFTRSKLQPTEFVEFINNDVHDFVNKLKAQPGKDIWLVGGGEFNRTLLNLKLIDEIIMTIIPVVLSRGIPLFGQGSVETKLNYVDSTVISSCFVQIKYIFE